MGKKNEIPSRSCLVFALSRLFLAPRLSLPFGHRGAQTQIHSQEQGYLFPLPTLVSLYGGTGTYLLGTEDSAQRDL